MIGILVCGGIVYGTNVYQSSTIEYSPTDTSWEVSNVNEALNDLYTKINVGTAKPEDILEGKTAIVNGKLVTGTLVEQSTSPNLSVTYNVTHTSQSGSTTQYFSVSTYLINTISISTSVNASHYGSYSITGFTSNGTGVALSGSQIDVSNYDSLVLRITCNGRNNSSFSQTGTYSVNINKIN